MSDRVYLCSCICLAPCELPKSEAGVESEAVAESEAPPESEAGAESEAPPEPADTSAFLIHMRSLSNLLFQTPKRFQGPQGCITVFLPSCPHAARESGRARANCAPDYGESVAKVVCQIQLFALLMSANLTFRFVLRRSAMRLRRSRVRAVNRR